MTKKILKYALLSGFFFMVGFFKSYHLPDLKLWTINQVDILTRSHGPMHIKISDIDFTAYPPGIHVNKIQILPKDEWNEFLEPIFLESLRFSINPFSFLTGLFQLSKIELIEPLIRVKANPKIKDILFSKKTEKPNFTLKQLLRIPLTNLTFRNLNLFIPAIENLPLIDLKNFSFDIENQKNSILLSVYAPSISILDKNISETPALISSGMRMLVFDDQILLSALKIQKGDSYILASGFLDSKITDLQFEQYQLKLKSNLDLENLKTHLDPFLQNSPMKQIAIPKVKGHAQNLITLTKKQQSPMETEFKFKFDNLEIDKFSVGDIVGKALIQNGNISSKKIEIKNSAGIIYINNLFYDYQNKNSYEAKLNVQQLELHEFLKNLGLGELPVFLDINTDIPCQGDLKQKKYLTCKGEINLKNLKVTGTSSDIVKATSANFNGSVDVTDTHVTASANIQLGQNSQGFAKASIQYSTGFKIEFESEKFDFSDVSISQLELMGLSKLKGHTSGNSSSAIFNIDLKSVDSEISKYFIGDLSTKLSYKAGKLNLSDIDGLIRATKYTGNLSVDLRNSSIKGNIVSPYLELSDLNKVFLKIAPLPFEYYGGGEAQTSFSGPLDFSKLSYDFSSRFLNGTIATESFDQIQFHVVSKDGYVSTKNASLKKGAGTLNLKAKAEPTGHLISEWKGSNFALQEINSFAKTDISMNGNLDFSLKLNGHILHPDSQMIGRITQSKISQEEVPDSQFEIEFSKTFVKGTAQLFGDQIQSKFKIPFSEFAPFSFQAKINKWDFSPLIHLISSRSRASEYSTLLTAELDLESKSNYLWNATGNIHLQNLSLQRGIKVLRLNEPTIFSFKEGQLTIPKLILSGDNTSLEIRATPQKDNPILMDINGKFDLGMLSFLTPFFEDLRGTAALTTQLKIKHDKWAIFGSSFISNGYLRVPEFPHAVENIEADLLFSDAKIDVNKMSAQFASGKATASGQIEIKGTQNIPIDIYGKFQDVQLLVPKDIHTKGSGDFRVHGNWFPYNMEGNYIIQSGLITKDFSEDGNTNSSFQRTQLLPKDLLKEVREVFYFDYDVIFSKGIDIKNELIDSKLYGKMRIKGPPTTPILQGGVQLQRNSKIYFKDTEFEVETGDLKFLDKNKINPELYISAKTNITETLDTTTQRYEINMLIQGKANSPSISLSSNPPRSEKDIISLLALGITTESYQTNSDQNQITKQSYEVGASILTKNKFGRDLKQKTGFEFKVSSALDQTTNTTAPKITISKQWSPRIETSASRTFGQSTTNDVKVEYQLNKNFSLIGSWEGREISNTNTNSDTTEKTTTDILGLDIEYKMEFK